MSPKISVVMPVYNSVETLPRSIESILHQTFPDFEFIIVNDAGSEDGSRELIEQYAEKDERVRLIQLDCRKGIAESLNIGIRNAKGKYIARMDADDVSYSNRLEREWEYMEAHPSCILCGSAIRVVRPSGTSFAYPICNSEQIKAELLFSCQFNHPTVIFPREAFERNGYFYRNTYICEDFDLWTRIDGTISNISEVLLDYHVGEENATVLYQEKLNKDGCSVVENQIRKRFGIHTENYHKQWYWPRLFQSNKFKSNDVSEGYRLLSEIEERNKEKTYCNPMVLADALCRRWNRYVAELFVYLETESFQGLPCLSITSRTSFWERMRESLCVDDAKVGEALTRRWQQTLQRLDSLQIKKAVVYGGGISTHRYLKAHPQMLCYITCFCDTDEKLWGKSLFDKKIIAPSHLNEIECEWIVISSDKYLREIRDNIVNKYHVFNKNIASIGVLRYQEKR